MGKISKHFSSGTSQQYGRTFTGSEKKGLLSSDQAFPNPPERPSTVRTTVMLDYNIKDNYMRKESERKKKLQAAQR